MREQLSTRLIFVLVTLIATCIAVGASTSRPESDLVSASKNLAICLACALFMRIAVSLMPICRLYRLALIVAVPITLFLTYVAYINFGLGYNVSVGLWPFAAYFLTCIGTEFVFVQLGRQQRRSRMHASS